MGREIRMVPPNWQHPKYTDYQVQYAYQRDAYHPMYNEDYDHAAAEWLQACIEWANGTHPDLAEHPEYKAESPYYWDYGCTPPDKAYYRERWNEEATWYQVYETVSEGTPVTPPFATKEELVDYLVEHGDFWDQRRGNGGWTRKNAEAFVKDEWAPSMIVTHSAAGTTIVTPRDMGDLKDV